MLTDIFAYRYLDQPIWPQYTDLEQRLLNQAFGIVKDALPYYTSEGKENEKIRDMWKLLHDRLAREKQKHQVERLHSAHAWRDRDHAPC